MTNHQHSHLNGLTHGQARIYTAVRRQGSAGASMGFLVDTLGMGADSIRQLIHRINGALDGDSIRSVADRYFVVGAEEAAFIRDTSVGSYVDRLYEPVWA